MWREYLEPRVIQYARNKGASDAALRADLREDMALSSYGWLWQWVFTCRLALIQIFTV
jgi:hypothetical protein